MKILAVGGGSGGHVTPVVAVIEQLATQQPKIDVAFVCDKAFESQARGLMKHASVPVAVSPVTAGKFRRYSHLSFVQHITNWHVVSGNVTDIAKIVAGFFQSIWIIMRFNPDVVFAKGGYVCLPMGIAAWVLRRPLVIHDSDTRPGLTNRVLSRFATKIATGAPLENYTYDSAKSVYVGVPIDAAFRPVTSSQQATYKQELGIDAHQKLVVATGGGLGAVGINAAVIRAAPGLRRENVVIYNITGKANFEKAQEQAKGIENYIPAPFIFEDMHKILGAADIVVSRASATFLQELAGLKKTVIAVPGQHLGDQLKNAKMFEAADAVVALTDTELASTSRLEETIRDLMNDGSRRIALATALHTFARPHAAADTAKLIVSAFTGKK